MAVVPKQATEDGDDDDLDLSLEAACAYSMRPWPMDPSDLFTVAAQTVSYLSVVSNPGQQCGQAFFPF